MSSYRKWIGGGVGWLIGGPVGGLLGFLAGNEFDRKALFTDAKSRLPLDDLETNIIVLCSHIARLRKIYDLDFLQSSRAQFELHLGVDRMEHIMQVFHHCLQKEYDLGIVCEQLRMYTTPAVQKQITAFLIAYAGSVMQGDERAMTMVRKICRYINVNDRDFDLILNGMLNEEADDYATLSVSSSSSLVEIRAAYRKLILQLHPDRNLHLSEQERKQLAIRFGQVKAAYERLKKKY